MRLEKAIVMIFGVLIFILAARSASACGKGNVRGESGSDTYDVDGMVACYKKLSGMSSPSPDGAHPLRADQVVGYEPDDIIVRGLRDANRDPAQPGIYLFSSKETVFFPIPRKILKRGFKEPQLFTLKLPPKYKKTIDVRCESMTSCSGGWGFRLPSAPKLKADAVIKGEEHSDDQTVDFIKPELLKLTLDVHAFYKRTRKGGGIPVPNQYRIAKKDFIEALVECRPKIQDKIICDALDDELEKFGVEAAVYDEEDQGTAYRPK